MTRPRDHRADFARRDERARAQGFRSYREKRRLGGASAARVRNDSEFQQLPPTAREQRRRALRALSESREGLSVEQAARQNDISIDAVVFWSGGVVASDGTVAATDRLWRDMRAISATTRAMANVDVRGSAAATRLSNYWGAVMTYLHTGDDTALRAFRSVRIAGVELETNTDVIDGLAVLGQLSFETIYQDVAA